MRARYRQQMCQPYPGKSIPRLCADTVITAQSHACQHCAGLTGNSALQLLPQSIRQAGDAVADTRTAARQIYFAAADRHPSLKTLQLVPQLAIPAARIGKIRQWL